MCVNLSVLTDMLFLMTLYSSVLKTEIILEPQQTKKYCYLSSIVHYEHSDQCKKKKNQ